MGFNSPLFLLGLSGTSANQGGFKTPLPNWNAGGATSANQGGFLTPLPGWYSGGATSANQGGFLTPLPFWFASAGTSAGTSDIGFGGINADQKPKRYSKIISFEAPSEAYKVDIPPLPLEETSYDYQKEIDRYGEAIELLSYQIEAAELELKLLEEREDLESQLKYELRLIDLRAAQTFVFDLIQEIYLLFQIKRRREEEELLIFLLMTEDDEVTILQ